MKLRSHSQWNIIGLALVLVLIAPLMTACGEDDTASPSPQPTSTATSPGTIEPLPTPSPTAQPAGFSLAKSSVERDPAPDVSGTDFEKLVAGNTAFAMDLYEQLRGEDGNLFFSPYSVTLALAMTYAGARGDTAAQMAETLRFRLPDEELHAAFNALDQALAEEMEGLDPEAGDQFTLSIANSLWGQDGYPFLQEFLDTLALNYGAGLRLLDYANDPEGARIIINDWISDETREKIQDLIPQGAITDLTRLVLANAIYFKATWLHQFEEELTQQGTFALLDGGEVTVPMMSWSEPVRIGYGQGDGYQAVSLPYIGNRAAMTIIVPDAGHFAEFEAKLTADKIGRIVDGLEHKSVDLNLPKFTYEQSISMADTLAQMGMPDAFDPDVADFSGMDGTRLLYITDVFHKAFVAVDEVGTEAAAATAVIVGLESMPSVDVELTVDRPFIYLIRDLDTGSILFLGRVVNPAG